MKKLSILVMFFWVTASLSAQTFSKKEAKRMLEKTVASLKISDSTAFINLWYLDNSSRPYHQRPYDAQDVKANFIGLQQFIDTALKQNFEMEEIEIEQQDKKDVKNYFAPYKIKAWFRCNKNYQKGMGFNVDFINGKWAYRNSPDYSVVRSK